MDESPPLVDDIADSNLHDEVPHDQSKSKVPGRRILGMTVEPVIFLSMLGSNLSGVLLTNLLMIKTCEYMKLPINCTDMETESGGPYEKEIQPYVATIGMYKLIYETVPPAIMSFFIGSWSDTYGRKPLMIAPLIGYCLNFLLLILYTWFDLPPMFVILTNTPLALLGGSMIFFTGAFCHVTDTSPKEDLSYRLALAEGMLYLGILCGNTAAPYLFNLIPSHGYEAVFGLSFCMCFCALLYTIFLIPESVKSREASLIERLKALFDYKQVIDLFRICFGHHEGHSRPIRLMIVAVTMLSLLAMEGTLATAFLFARNKFSWDVKQFSIYVDAALLINIVGVLLGTIVFSKLAKLPNEPLSCFGYFLKACGYLIGGLGNAGWYLYLSSAVSGLGGMSSPLNRAIMAETVPKNDIGKLFSIVSAFVTFIPIVAALSYTFLYNSTMNTFPGAIYLFSAALSAISCIAMGVVCIIRKFCNSHPYTLAEENENDDQ
ncbi:Proton-coupled folate transporter [Frankliniella fusca]|uniref:Proton-coupled folate transporter n=1 Tax=Frankliniella fusca TaxID=407009 RepID=A0AAE1GRZ7_9NEOP|nr:Proton-coupled folate transporter [Frankliniella fusca]